MTQDRSAAVPVDTDIEINDLYAFARPEVTAWQAPDQCHFDELGYERLGQQVGETIERTLTAAG